MEGRFTSLHDQFAFKEVKISIHKHFTDESSMKTMALCVTLKANCHDLFLMHYTIELKCKINCSM